MTQITRADGQSQKASALEGEGTPSSSGFSLGSLLQFLVWGGMALFLLLMGLRHPFIGRRLLIMGPTLLIISLVVFFIIQLPPGDYLQTRIMELQMIGDETAVKQVQDLQEQFHTEDPSWARYARWMGFTWFTSFSSEDAGLLQGNLGRSMEDGRLVNDLVGDRILLTITISSLTILFVWITALSIGIFSAVRQYSFWTTLSP